MEDIEHIEKEMKLIRADGHGWTVGNRTS